MEWKWFRRIFILAGVVYLWALIPVSIRPRVPDSTVFRKSTQTITLDIDTPTERAVPLRAAGAVEKACKPPLLMTPFERKADSARVLLRYGTTIVADVTVKCASFGT